MKNKYIFFRNDDVRDTLDDSLIKITEICIKHGVPISHAVEPANITSQVVNWLLELKNNHNGLIEIIQHGYSHKLNYQKMIGGKLKKGEFGGNRSYDEQYAEILRGKELMDEYFGELWFSLFVFPFGGKNEAAIKALADAGLKCINGSMDISWQNKVFYLVGRLFKKIMMMNRKISWNLRYIANTHIFQIDTSIYIIKKYIDEYEACEFYSLGEIKSLFNKYMKKVNNIGIVLHHRYHNIPQKIKLVDELITWLKTIPNIEFVNQEQLYKKYSN